MSVLLETSIGDLVIDLFTEKAPKTCFNFLKLCNLKFYNDCLFFNVEKDYIAQTGDPSNGKNISATSVWGLVSKDLKQRYFDDEISKSKFNTKGLVATSNIGMNLNSSTFFIQLSDTPIESFYKKYTVFGQVVEGLENIDKLNKVIVDSKTNRPLQNVRIKHTMVINDPYDGEASKFGLTEEQVAEPSRSPSPQRDMNDANSDEEVFLEDDEVNLNQVADSKTAKQIEDEKERAEAQQRKQVLEILDDLPEADIEPPSNVLFVCKLNPATQGEDLEIIFSRFGKVLTCEVIRDWKTGDSLQYAFVEFETEDTCILAYSKMDGVLVDERRIKVDFSNSVAKQWNEHRRKKLRDEARKILETEQVSKQKSVYKLPFHQKNEQKESYNSRDKHHTDNRDRRNRSRSNERKRSYRDRDYSPDRRHKSHKRSRSPRGRDYYERDNRDRNHSHRRDDYYERDRQHRRR